ncbi:transcription factor IIA subunit alpha [Fusarium equiseti]|uniref:Transcription factor IIA subunit alpha n=1 Tax=Fusarium equiseti TaxID=61235 RepID=A0ABQ8RLB6_FUSEQ|nr:transcription factor IIA subunit alpha [Fusarium equiseti]
MSNQAVGAVYKAIIDDVVNSSRVDFEESGVEESVLEELRQGWQRKLTQLDVAAFPWDPKPDPPPVQVPQPAMAAPQTHAQAQFSPQLNNPTGLSLPGMAQPQVQNGVKPEGNYVKTESSVPIKQEPGLQGNPMAYQQYTNPNPNINMNDKNNVAANRAAQQLQAQYGQRAAGSINALHQQQQPHPQQGQQQQPQQQQPALPQQQQTHQQQQPAQQPNLTQQQQHQQQMYRQQMAAATAQQQQQHPSNGHPHIQNGQTDGAGDVEDYEGVLMERAASGDFRELGRVEIDRMLHEQILAKAKSMEGGGLMVPLKEASRHSTASGSRKAKGKQPAAYDGGDDDEEDDDDAINSDLDDPEDDRDDDDVDDEGLGNIMLCMYDKVQRVKNKWKCTLKDGVLTVNGKEYVFHKATGEYEW